MSNPLIPLLIVDDDPAFAGMVQQLVAAEALEGASASEVSVPTLQVSWDALLRDLQGTTTRLNQIFLR